MIRRTENYTIRCIFCVQHYLCKSISMKSICYLIAAFMVSFGILSYVHEASYVWQVTSLASVTSPVYRDSCEFTEFGNEVASITSSTVAPKIAILMMYENLDGNWGKPLMNRVLANRESYCKQHGYTLITANDLIDHSRPPAWSKLIGVKHHLATNKYDYIMYMDMDVIIMNPDVKLDTFVALSAPKSPDLIMTSDWNGLNSGNWFAKNTDWSQWFLQLAFNQTQLIAKTSTDGKAHPFEYEQRAFHYLIDSQVWRDRNLPKYRPPADATPVNDHIYMFPQCSFNSYVMHPTDFRGEREESQYVNGDFLVHFAGKKGKIKTNLMEYYLDVAEAAAAAATADTTITKKGKTEEKQDGQ